jgi:regulator of RNase E activity RraA
MVSNKSPIPDGVIDRLRSLDTTILLDVMVEMLKWPMTFVQGAKTLTPGCRMAGRAVTLRFVPSRPDLMADKPREEKSPEFEAMALCGPSDVLVIDAMGWADFPVGGDIKFLGLKNNRAGGLVTDGALRDTRTLKDYGFPIYCSGPTARQGTPVFVAWGVNEVVQCGATLVRPGDAVVGDDDGVVIVPRAIVDDVLERVPEQEGLEAVARERIEAERCSPGKYYPFTDRTRELYERPSR